MRVIGIDEAGYGPLLGPLVVGAVSLECEDYDPQRLWRALGEDSGIADSKQVLSHRNMARGEETTLALLALAGWEPKDRRELMEQVVIPAPSMACKAAAAVCRATGLPVEGSGDQGWGCAPDDQPLPRWGQRPSARRIEELQRRLASEGVSLATARAALVCPGHFNEAVAQGANKLRINWSLFRRLLEHDRAQLAPGGLAACGKLSGQRRYQSLLAGLGDTEVLEEEASHSAYLVQGLGRVEFVRHAEAAHPPVAMASMIAKMLREHVMDQWHGLLSRLTPGLGTCSGYRDVVTKRYVAATESARQRLGIPDACFLRCR
jgi:ribonuclease HII